MNMEAELQKLTNFLKANYPDIVPLPTRVGKEPTYSFKDKSTDCLWKWWDKFGYHDIAHGYAQGVTLLLRNSWIVIDFDDAELAEHFEKNCLEFQQAPKQQTKKGFHYYFLRPKSCDEEGIYSTIRPFGDTLDIDILTKRQEGKEAGMISVYPSPNKVWVRSIYDTPMFDLPYSFIEFYNAHKTSKPKRKEIAERCKNDGEQCEQYDESKNKIDFETLKDIVSNLSDKRADDYNVWTRTLWAIYNLSRWNGYVRKGRDLIHEFSKRSFMYNEDEVEKYIDNANNKDDGVGLGTLMDWLKIDNEVVFHNIQAKINSVKKVELNGYSFIDEPPFDVFDGEKREYDIVKGVFEIRHFKVMRPLMYVEILEDGECFMRNPKQLKDTFVNVYCTIKKVKGENVKVEEKTFIDMWIKDAKIRTYNTIDFLPPPLKCPSNTFNMWRGFAAERLEVESSRNIEPIINHIKILVNHDMKALDYFIKFIAQMVQQPGRVCGIAMVLKSEQGSGKNRFLDFMSYILGTDLYYETADPVNNLWSRFAKGRKNKLLINIDETSGKDTYPHADKLKNMITSPTFNFEEKGVSPITLLNINRIIFTTNNTCAVKIEEGDRRFVVLQCSDEMKGNKAYFDELTQYIEEPSHQKAFFEYLQGIDISNIDWINDRPITELYRDIQEVSIPIHIKFFKWLFETTRGNDNHEHEYTGYTLFEMFNVFLEQGKYTGYSLNQTSFGRLIKDLIMKDANDATKGFIEKYMSNGRVKYAFLRKHLKDWLISKHYLDPLTENNGYAFED
jgi:hypothetical protein